MILIVPLNGSAADSELAEDYAPILYFEGEETCYPVEAEYIIENSALKSFDTDTETSLSILENPLPSDLASYTTEQYSYYYLDNSNGALNNNGVVSKYQSDLNTIGYTVYAYVSDQGSRTVIQYWMCYVFNAGSVNTHEGDWECVMVVLEGGSPTEVYYSQHHSGQKVSWDLVEKTGDHVKVYVSRGSHANYARPYSGSLGVAMDIVNNNGLVLTADDYDVEILDSQDWLSFSGRWGQYDGIEQEIRGMVGPYGPMYREDSAMWNAPIMWGESLSESSSNLFLAEWFVYYFIWIFVAISLVSLAWTGFKIYKRYKSEGLGPRILTLLYIDGLNVKSIGNILCIVALLVGILALFNPWYVMSADIGVPGYDTGGMVDLLRIDGVNGFMVNFLDGSGSLTPIGGFAMPFWIFIGIGLVFFMLSLIGLRLAGKAGKKYIHRGIDFAIPVIAVIIIIAVLPMIAQSFGLIESGGNEVTQVFDALGASPLGGSTSLAFEISAGETSTLALQWGLGSGGWMLILSAIIFIVAGALLLMSSENFFEAKDQIKK